MEFQFTEKANAGLYRLSGSLIGEHDGASMLDHFAEKAEDGIIRIALDLSAMKHVNSTGLGVFVTLLTRARKKGGEVVLVNPSDYIRNLLLITKLNSIFQVLPSEEAAFETLAKS